MTNMVKHRDSLCSAETAMLQCPDRKLLYGNGVGSFKGLMGCKLIAPFSFSKITVEIFIITASIPGLDTYEVSSFENSVNL